MSPRTNRRTFLALSATGVAAAGAARTAAAPQAAAAGRPAQDHQLRLWYPRPASEWLQALPVGNGRLGAMVHGGVASETLQLNEDTVWAGGPYDPANPSGLDNLERIRELVFAGEYAAAQELVDRTFMGTPLGELPYQTVGDLVLTFPGGGEASDYYRELDLTTATALTRYTRDGVTHTREVFASAPDQVIVVRLTADAPGSVSFSAAFSSPQASTVHSPDPLTAGLDGTTEDWEGVPGQVAFRALVTARADGGTVTSEGGTLTVTGADAVTLLVSVGSSYTSYQDVTGDQNARAAAPLAAAADREYEELRARHVADYQELFHRVSLDVGTSGAAALPTDERVAGFASGDDPQLVTLFFQFGRYLLISSSRPGTQPANLQGLWNDSLSPDWDSKYTVNINTEMNYWPAGPANLIETMEPLLDMVDELAVTGARTAATQYGAGGWVCHHNTDAWRGTAPVDGAFWGMWPTGGAWLALQIWEHYRFTGDLGALRARYPALRGAAQFFADTLVTDPNTGYLVTCPSSSPENAHHPDVSICAGPTMDAQILRDLFTAVAAASELLETDAEFRATVRELARRLPPTRIGSQGQIQEWQEDWDAGAPEQNHRHVSHLYGLHPSNQITPEGTPELAEAARVTLEQRGDAGTGWSLAWKINFWARLWDGARSFQLLRDQLTPDRTAPNLFCLHPPFQIDGNFGATAGITEWLVQSHTDVLRLLPALPPELPEGQVTGLRARGGETVDLTWRDGQLTRAAVHAGRTRTLRVAAGVPVTVSVAGGGRVAAEPDPAAAGEDAVTAFAATAGTTYLLTPRPAASGS
ncbi:glycoside hydrolase N-terminal domain-containing protein [Streptomyces sp. 7-21]|uniref:glycoside hydrolase family 95 protein n=1 Tax=Streptomyces sp. 7-21 TaxID=2802283 RepID=UPI00191D7775|nr:glycoside hydrolase family 95 protein [Streptomyces sp. 7-21]MBL1066905.1 glycoside hydrolase family 95 protein [Streptomyces sp. 7-21]